MDDPVAARFPALARKAGEHESCYLKAAHRGGRGTVIQPYPDG